MEFLKKHYEKIILTVFLILFVVSLFYLISVIREVKEKSVDRLQLPKVSPDQQPIDFNAEKYAPASLLAKSGLWNKREKINPESIVFTDLVVPYEIAKCPHCERYVAKYYFLNDPHKCQFCSGDLPEPPKVEGPVTTGIDTDGDGITDADEKKFGLNPNDPKDAVLDNDGDGFPNFFEIERGFHPNDPKSHPPLCLRLHVVRVYRTQLGIKLKRLQVKGENRGDWDIQIDVWARGRWNTRFVKLNDKIKVFNDEFTIIDCKPKKEERFDEKTKTNVEKDVSEVTIQQNDDKIVMVVDQNVYAPRETVHLRDVAFGNEYKIGLDASFKIGDDRTGVENYKIISIDAKQNEVQVINEKDNKIYDISARKRFEYTAATSTQGAER